MNCPSISPSRWLRLLKRNRSISVEGAGLIFVLHRGRLEKVEEETEDVGPTDGQGNALLLRLRHVIRSEKHANLPLVDGPGRHISFELLESAVQRHGGQSGERCRTTLSGMGRCVPSSPVSQSASRVRRSRVGQRKWEMTTMDAGQRLLASGRPCRSCLLHKVTT
ncbi:hypothetical protein HPB50_025963 [Hyalomma asiaticum]|uniref:Uncharacterized protein n=1 Tax=Hyalomma asiaticum TaxID=266040 RepID=A0ACB7SZX3_HYAAI|nr:hypothetical protein HPB50_025963 [Hyalomma asiaticum]